MLFRSSGYRLQVSIRSPQVTGVDITGLDGGPISVAYPAAVVYQPWTQGSLRNYAVNFRFQLAPGTPPGSLEWPVEINVLPL